MVGGQQQQYAIFIDISDELCSDGRCGCRVSSDWLEHMDERFDAEFLQLGSNNEAMIGVGNYDGSRQPIATVKAEYGVL